MAFTDIANIIDTVGNVVNTMLKNSQKRLDYVLGGDQALTNYTAAQELNNQAILKSILDKEKAQQQTQIALIIGGAAVIIVLLLILRKR